MESAILISKIEELYLSIGYPLIFFGSLIEATPIAWIFPGGAVVALAGFYAYSGHLSLLGILMVGFLGEVLSFVLAYYLGYSKSGLVKFLKQESAADKAGVLFRKHGALILTTSMLAGVTRFFVSFIAGQQKYPLGKFIFYAATASLTWTGLMVTVGYLVGSERENIEKALRALGMFGWALLILAGAIIVVKARQEFKQFKGEKDENTGN